MNTEEKAKAYDDALEKAKKELKTCGSMDCDAVRQIFRFFPELKENKSEKIIEDLIATLKLHLNGMVFMSKKQRDAYVTYLEKQKELFSSGIGLYYYDGEKTIYCGYPVIEENPHDFAISQQEKQKDYRKLYEDIAQSEWFKKNYVGKSLGEEFEQKEQKPILEVFGFKVGDAVRLKDGDGRKHIIKSFEEVKGLHGPNFYHVEFEDNSARDSIYPSEEYPNGYYTQMEKIKDEQKHTLKFKVGDKVHLEGDNINILTITGIGEDRYFTDCAYGPILFGTEDVWQIVEQKSELPKPHKGDDNNPYDMGVSEAQEYAIKRGFGIPFNDGEVYVDERYMTQTIGNVLRWADEHPKEQKSAEWSEEDEKILKDCIDMPYSADFISMERKKDAIRWLKSLRPQPHWKPRKEQMDALLWCVAHLGGADHRVLAELYEHLKKLM